MTSNSEQSVCKVPLSKGYFALVDEGDYARVMQYKWSYLKGGYAVRVVCRKGKQTMIYLHRFLTDAQPGEEIDHEDLNKLNCTRRNLRRCSHQQNMQNAWEAGRSTSGYKGVLRSPGINRWRAEITVGYKSKHLGCFGTPEEAALAYNKAAQELHGEFARLNPLPSNGGD